MAAASHFLTRTFSQVGQDLFVLRSLGSPGFYFEVGASHPFYLSNTALLEEQGWVGLSIDLKRETLWDVRKNPCVEQDALGCDFVQLFDRYNLPYHVQYITLDIDENQEKLVQIFPWEKISADLLTIEHDAYCRGDGPRDSIRQKLQSQGYSILLRDVLYGMSPFEDWWIRKPIIA